MNIGELVAEIVQVRAERGFVTDPLKICIHLRRLVKSRAN
jgi:hypothetical protein